MRNFTLNIKEMDRLKARMQKTGVDVNALCPICLTCKDCNPKNYPKANTHGYNEIIEL